MDLGFLTSLKTSGRVSSKDLVGALQNAIESGQLQPGDRLPSLREFALFLNVAKTTVARAFDQLTATGHLSAQKGSGTFVAFGSKSAANPKQAAHAVSSAAGGFPWAGRFNTLAERVFLQDPDYMTSGDLEAINYGATPLSALPLHEWKSRVIAQYRAHEIVPGGNKTEPFGFRPLREALVGFLRRSKGIQCDASQIVLYSSSQSAINHILSLLAEAGQKAIVENPGFAGAREHFRFHGLETMPMPVDSDGMIVSGEKLENVDADWVYVTPACQDPTGAVLSKQRREVLLHWSKTHDVAIIEDGWDSDFHYGSTNLPTLFAADTTGCVLYLYTFWRLLYPLTSVTLLVLPPPLVDVFHTSKRTSDPPFATAEDVVLADLLDNGYLEKHIRSLWKQYRKQRQAVMFELTKQFAKLITVLPYSGGMHVTVRFNPDWSPSQIVDAGRISGLPLEATASYYTTDAVPNEFLVYFANVEETDAEKTIEKFANSLKKATR